MHLRHICKPHRPERKRADISGAGAAEEGEDPEQVPEDFGDEGDEGG